MPTKAAVKMPGAVGMLTTETIDNRNCYYSSNSTNFSFLRFRRGVENENDAT